jgi:hypothetical protein
VEPTSPGRDPAPLAAVPSGENDGPRKPYARLIGALFLMIKGGEPAAVATNSGSPDTADRRVAGQAAAPAGVAS